MKARLRLQDKISSKQKANIQEFCAQELKRKEKEHARRMLKIFCVALHEEFGFGGSRCMRLINRINQLSQKRDEDEIFWTHTDRLMAYLGLQFEEEDYDVVDL